MEKPYVSRVSGCKRKENGSNLKRQKGPKYNKYTKRKKNIA